MAVLLFPQLVYLADMHTSANKSHWSFFPLESHLLTVGDKQVVNTARQGFHIPCHLPTFLSALPTFPKQQCWQFSLHFLNYTLKLNVHWHIAADLSISYRNGQKKEGKFPVIISFLLYFICIICCTQSENTENGLILQHGSTAQTSVVKSTMFLHLL